MSNESKGKHETRDYYNVAQTRILIPPMCRAVFYEGTIATNACTRWSEPHREHHGTDIPRRSKFLGRKPTLQIPRFACQSHFRPGLHTRIFPNMPLSLAVPYPIESLPSHTSMLPDPRRRHLTSNYQRIAASGLHPPASTSTSTSLASSPKTLNSGNRGDILAQ